MERKRKRVTQAADGDDTQHSNNAPDRRTGFAGLLDEASEKTALDIKLFVQEHSTDLKTAIQEHRHVEEYVTKNHADQAAMLRKLNEELREERLEKNKLIRENTDLKRKLSQAETFESCARMMRTMMTDLKQEFRNQFIKRS